jgi:mannose-6-phosphate isomerase-like protein (cupin superfamily)
MMTPRMAPITKDNAEHYHWGTGCDGWHLVKNHRLSVIQEHMRPNAAEARHHHERARQFFYVLSGELHIEAHGAVHLLRAGEGLEVEPGTVHKVTTGPIRDAEFLVISEPPAADDRHEASLT